MVDASTGEVVSTVIQTGLGGIVLYLVKWLTTWLPQYADEQTAKHDRLIEAFKHESKEERDSCDRRFTLLVNLHSDSEERLTKVVLGELHHDKTNVK